VEQTHWTIFVDWKTVIGWKQEMRYARESNSGVYPYQYGSSQERFADTKKGDVLWVLATCRSRILMQPSEDRHGEGHGPLGIQQHCRVPLLVRDDRPARRCSRIGVSAKDGSNRDTTT